MLPGRPRQALPSSKGKQGLAALSLAGLQATQAEPAVVAAHISTDAEVAYADGCVGCHDGTAAETVGALLETMGHPDVDADTEVLPDDCSDCHSEEGGLKRRRRSALPTTHRLDKAIASAASIGDSSTPAAG